MLDWIPEHLPWNDAATNFAGVFLGALLAYVATLIYDHKERQARRAALFRALRRQLCRYPPQMHRFVRGLHNHIDPISVSAIGHLLAGDVLDARKDGALIEKLSDLATVIEQLNEYGRTYNLNFFTAALYLNDPRFTDERASSHRTYSNIYANYFIKRRDEVLAILPPDPEAASQSDAPAEPKPLQDHAV